MLLALTTFFCNDIYREANKRSIIVSAVEVVCEGEFGDEGEPRSNFKYKANVAADAASKEIEDMISYVDKIAEVHNTLRRGVDVSWKNS